MRWTEQQLSLLLRGEPICQDPPWCQGVKSVEDYYRWVLAEVERKTGWKCEVEWGHYGSGYASYVDVWIHQPHSPGLGLGLLLSRLSPYFVFFQNQVDLRNGRRTTYSLPDLELTDDYADSKLAAAVQKVLEEQQLVRLYAQELTHPLPPGTAVPTLLGDPPYSQWDALFYWED